MVSKLAEKGCSRDDIEDYIETTVGAMEKGTYPPTQMEGRFWTTMYSFIRDLF